MPAPEDVIELISLNECLAITVASLEKLDVEGIGAFGYPSVFEVLEGSVSSVT
jgi:hypothetical protein